MKFLDVDSDRPNIAAAGNIQNGGTINIIPQGVLETERIGRKVTIRSINWRWTLNLNPSSGGDLSLGADVVRVILYLDRQCNGSTATTVLILESANFQSFNNLANKSRFRILMDRVYTLNSPAGAGNGTANDTGPVIINDSLYKKCNIPIEFDNSLSTGVLSTIRSNNLGILLISESALTDMDSKIRLRFSDD